nr:leucine-rich repeat protein [Eubacterium sp.]
MKKTIIVSIFFVLFLFCASPEVVCAAGTMTYDVIDGDTLVISGNGELKAWLNYEDKIKKLKVEKLIIKEGVTKIRTSAQLYRLSVEEIVLPNTLVEIQEGAFASNEHLENVKFGNNLKIIGNSAFSGCENLKQVILPDSVTEIGDSTFSQCYRLKKIVLPVSLISWNVYAVRDCPALRTVVNRSKVSCEMIWYSKYITWKVGKKKTRTIPPGKTGKAIAKKIPIKWHLMGGTATGKLPKYFRFGSEVKLPNCVKRKGYVFMGWSTHMYHPMTKIEIGDKKAEFYATWYKYKVKSNKTGTATLTFDGSEAKVRYTEHVIRYSASKDMKNYREKFVYKNKGKAVIKGLEPGRTYYFEISGLDEYNWDVDMEYRSWMGKCKVAVHA